MKPIAAIFVADPKCSVQSANGILNALGDHYRFKIFSKHPLEDNFFDNVDLIAVPGGIGDSDSFDTLLKHNADRIRDFVARGGHYLGICMGAYWACAHYLDITKDIRAEQYLRRPGSDTRRPHAKDIGINWLGEPMSMFWYDGCALVGGKKDIVATYANGDAMAIIQNRIGLIGCHPESEQFWYNSYSWLRGKYHDGRHHELLLNFTKELMTR
jgi:hypothetical protein